MSEFHDQLDDFDPDVSTQYSLHQVLSQHEPSGRISVDPSPSKEDGKLRSTRYNVTINRDSLGEQEYDFFVKSLAKISQQKGWEFERTKHGLQFRKPGT